MLTCPRCGSPYLVTTVLDSGPHYGRLDCGACHRWLRWIPKPHPEPTPEVFRRAAASAPAASQSMPELVGSPSQIPWVENLRPVMLARIRLDLGKDAWLAARGIASTGWWIANRTRPTSEIRWPAEWFEAQDVQRTS